MSSKRKVSLLAAATLVATILFIPPTTAAPNSSAPASVQPRASCSLWYQSWAYTRPGGAVLYTVSGGVAKATSTTVFGNVCLGIGAYANGWTYWEYHRNGGGSSSPRLYVRADRVIYY